MGKHALLNASSAHRWLTCPPLPRLENFFEKEVSEVANEGTDAHRLSEYKLRKVLGEKVRKPKLKYFDKDMDSYTDDYVNYIVETIENIKKSTKDPIVLIEQRLDFSNYVPDGFGTGDCIIIADKILHIIDLKYGRGVEVSAEENPQMMLYALGALNIYDALYDIDEVVMTIFQPRKYNISSSKKSVEELKNWADTVLKEKAELAFNGLGVVTYGPWCQFSNCNVVLRARKDYHDKLMRFQLRSPHLLNDAEIEEVLEHIDDLVKWASEIKEYATKITLENDKEWSNYKLVEGRSIRKIKDEERVAEILEENGYKDIYKTSLITLTELQKLLGKDKFNELLGDYIIKPEGKPTLVLKSDKRKEIVKHDVNKEFKVMEEKIIMAIKDTKVVTGVNTRFSYFNGWEPVSINGSKERYSVSVLIPKSDTKTINAVHKAVDAAIEDGLAKFGGKKPNKATLKLPLRDGDVEREDEAYKGHYFINANSTTAPQIVDNNVQPILDRSEVYSGCYGRVSLNFYAFNSNGNKGIACGLGNIQKLRDGEPLGGRSSASDDFTTEEDEEFLA